MTQENAAQDLTSDREMRTADVAHEDISTACLGCGRLIHLYFNGGELDGRACCGYEYRLEHVRIDLVVVAPPLPPAGPPPAGLSEFLSKRFAAAEPRANRGER